MMNKAPGLYAVGCYHAGVGRYKIERGEVCHWTRRKDGLGKSLKEEEETEMERGETKGRERVASRQHGR